ncbi:hypothetical protein HY627_01575 [Candidatus Uhrbacteria bacterium]|nr:hypothetical protein [Candidatus Uhrbacteria bacterium]
MGFNWKDLFDVPRYGTYSILALAVIGDLGLGYKVMRQSDEVTIHKSLSKDLTKTIEAKNREIALAKGISLEEARNSFVSLDASDSGASEDATGSATIPRLRAVLPLSGEPGDAWKDLELTESAKAHLEKIGLSGIALTGGSIGAPVHARPLQSRERDSMTAAFVQTLREGGISLEAGMPSAHGAVYAIGDPKTSGRIFGYVSSLPSDGASQFTDTFDVSVDGAFASASVTIGMQIRRDIARQRAARSTGPLAGLSLGRVEITTARGLGAFLTAGTQEQLLTEGARFGNGPSLAGRLDGEFNDDGELVRVSGSIFGRLGTLLTSFAIPIDVSCTGFGPCGELVGNTIAMVVSRQRTVDAITSGIPRTIR